MPNKQIQIAFVSLFILSQLTVVSFAKFVFEDVVRYGSGKTPEKFLDPNLPECKIFNGQYVDEFIKTEPTETQKSSYLNRHAYIRNVTLSSYNTWLMPERSMWQFVPVSHIKNGFYLRNIWNGAYLKAINKFRSSFPSGQLKRRYVIMWTPETLETVLTSILRPDKNIERKMPHDDSFVWILKKSEEDYEKITIFNAMYNEPLYAGTYLMKGSVFTWAWHSREPESGKNFLWKLDCTGKAPI